MQKKFFQYHTEKRFGKYNWKSIVASATAAVLIVTNCAPLPSAAAMENGREVLCGYTEHTHTEACYDESTEMICGADDSVLHTHGEICYDRNGELRCTLTERIGHTHTEECYEITKQDSNADGENQEGSEESAESVNPNSANPDSTNSDSTNSEGGEVAHVHTDACYEEELICRMEENHVHGEECYENSSVLICESAENQEDHIHGEECYEEAKELICELEENHVHGENCYERNLICEKTEQDDNVPENAEPNEQPESDKASESADAAEYEPGDSSESADTPEENGEPSETRKLICSLREETFHEHDENCYNGEELICTQPVLTAHVHTEECFQTVGLICGLEEHTHSAKCYLGRELTDKEQEQLSEVIALIEALPSNEEIEEKVAEFEEAEDMDGLEAYLAEIRRQALAAQEAYEKLGEILQMDVLNAEKLMDLEWLWSMITLEEPPEIKVLEGDEAYIKAFRVNSYLTGTSPWDDDDEAGNDKSENNDVVRSFDTISYVLELKMDSYNEDSSASTSFSRARACFAFVLPVTKDKAEFAVDSMAWMDTTSGYEYRIAEENGKQILYCSRLMTPADDDSYVIPGTKTVNVNIYVKGMHQGEIVQPEFYAWLEGNDVHSDNWSAEAGVYSDVVLDDSRVCDAHQQYAVNHGKEMWKAVSAEIAVSAKMKLNVMLTGITDNGVGTWDFSSGNEKAVNKSYGKIDGKAFQIGIALQLYNDAGKGLKGLAYPDGEPITVDLAIDTAFFVVEGNKNKELSLTADTYDFTPLLYTYGESTGAYKNGDGRNIQGLYQGYPYNAGGENNTYCCHDGGTWSAVQNGNVISLTIKDYKFSGKFPITYPSATDKSLRTIGENIGYFSVGRLGFVLPYYNVRKGGTNGESSDYIGKLVSESGTFQIDIRDRNLAAKSADKTALEAAPTDNANQMEKGDDNRSMRSRLDPPGTYSNVIMYGKRDIYNQMQPLTKDCAYNGRDWTYAGTKIGILAGVWQVKNMGVSDNNIIAYDDFVKFDADAIELADEYIGSSKEQTKGLIYQTTESKKTYADGYQEGADDIADYYLSQIYPFDNDNQCSLLYAVKSDGKNWDSEDQMRAATQESDYLTFYDRLSEANAKGKIVGVLIQVRGEIRQSYPRAGLYAKVLGNANQDTTYMITDTLRVWSWRSLETLNNSLPAGGEKITEIPMRTESNLGYSKTDTLNAYLEAAVYKHHPSYEKLVYNADGSYSGDKQSGIAYGDSLLVLGYTTGISLDVVNREADSEGKYTYDMDAGETYVDFQAQPTIQLSKTMEEVTFDTDAKTTVTAKITLPDGLAYIDGSSYWGGTYKVAAKAGRQGTVEGGLKLSETESVEHTYTYKDGTGAEKKATITISLQRVQQTDGTTVLTYIFKDVPLQDSSFSDGGLQNLLYFSTSIESKGALQWSLEEKAVISGEGDRRVQSIDNGNLAKTSIIVTQSAASGIAEKVEQLYNELNAELGWLITYSNNASNDVENAVLLSVLPYTGYRGTYTMTGWALNVDRIQNYADGDLELYFTTDESVQGTDAGSYNAESIKKNWKKIDLPKAATKSADGYICLSAEEIQKAGAQNATAWVVIGKLNKNSAIVVKQNILPAGNRAGDAYQNVASFRTSDDLALASYATAYIVSRTLEGVTWLDENKDGFRDAQEKLISGVDVTLYQKVDNSYQVYMVNGKTAKVTTGYQLDTVTGEEKQCSAGEYRFTSLPEGDFKVVFNGSIDGKAFAEYTASPVDAGKSGPNDTNTKDDRDDVDSDGVPYYDTNEDLVSAQIERISMPSTAAITSGVFASSHHDFGFYPAVYSLTVSKEVTGSLGDRNRDFSFTITLYEKEDGSVLTGTYTASGSAALTGPSATDTAFSLTEADKGKVTFTLKHGQSMTIQGLPKHCYYSVEEIDYSREGYISSADGETECKDMKGDKSVKFTNSADAAPPTGIDLDVLPHALLLLLILLFGGTWVFLDLKKRQRIPQKQ